MSKMTMRRQITTLVVVSTVVVLLQTLRYPILLPCSYSITEKVVRVVGLNSDAVIALEETSTAAVVEPLSDQVEESQIQGVAQIVGDSNNESNTLNDDTETTFVDTDESIQHELLDARDNNDNNNNLKVMQDEEVTPSIEILPPIDTVNIAEIDQALQTTTTNDRPNFVLHIGAGKTGTTTLQYELAQWGDELALDDYIYAGNTQHAKGQETFRPFYNTLHQNLIIPTDPNDTKCNLPTPLANILKKGSCLQNWTIFSDAFAPFRGKNIVVSHEDIGGLVRLTTTTYKDVYKMDWAGLQQALPEYNIIIVVSYRRYTDWVHSWKQHMLFAHFFNRKDQAWPEDPENAPLFPDFAFSMVDKFMPHMLIKYTNSVGLPLRIFNIHDVPKTQTMRTAFVCDVLPNAVEACRQSMEYDVQGKSEKVLNSEKPTVYSLIAMAAKNAGLVDTTVQTHQQLAEQIEWFHLKRLRALSDEPITKAPLDLIRNDLPLSCPPIALLQKYLNISESFEKELLSNFAATNANLLKHEVAFWQSVRSKKYCDVDVDSVVHLPDWENFFNTKRRVARQRAVRSDNNNKQPVERRKFILHIGAHKTGTTSIQSELVRWKEELIRDNYKYAVLQNANKIFTTFLKSIVKPAPTTTITLANNATTVNLYELPDTFHKAALSSVAYTGWSSFKTTMRKYQNKNIVLSHEGIDEMIKASIKSNYAYIMDWEGLQKALPMHDFHIVVSYRRYVTWLPSAKLEAEYRGDWNVAYKDWPQDGGTVIPPLFPDYAFLEPPFMSPAALVEYARSSMPFPLSILNMHDLPNWPNASLRSAFMCQSLINATNTCRVSKEADIQGEESLHVNSEKISFYDRIACEAARVGLTEKKPDLTRLRLEKRLEEFHRNMLSNVHGIAPNNIPNKMLKSDLPLICPDKASLIKFVNISLTHESMILPEFAASNKGSLKHSVDFLKDTLTNKYCSVDVQAVVANNTWRKFILHVK